ncbi:MAG: ATP-binding protein [bacterium]|nr:ATP-binding protein [bacterium]
MPREFNTSGPCLAESHYMLPPLERLSQVRELIDRKKYFIIHAPRQTGKTTLLRSLSRQLTEEGSYAAITVSLESFTQDDPDKSLPRIVRHIIYTAQEQLPAPIQPKENKEITADPDTALLKFLKEWSAACAKPIVIFFDEIDSLPGKTLTSVLRQLRDGYTSRPAPFPQSVALVGLRDIRDYKIPIGDNTILGSASPFNIKEESFLLRNFTADEVKTLLLQHTNETGQLFHPDAAGEIFFQTGGQPWLVNALASQLTTRYDALLKDPSLTVTVDNVIEAREILIRRRDTHLDSLVDKLREDRVQRVIEPILVGESIPPDIYNDDLKYVEDLGLISRASGSTEISNPIYREIIPRSLTYVAEGNIPDEPAWYIDKDGFLDTRKVIDGFIEFWRENGEVLLRGMPYHEAAPHLSFMAYLQRVVNSGGHISREFALGTKRADLVVNYKGRKDIIELKLARAYKALERGLEQVSAYAARLGQKTGYLVIFDTNAESPLEERGSIEEIVRDGINVVVVWV